MERLKLKTQVRDNKEKAGILRKNGFIPALLYNHGKTDHVKVDAKDVKMLFSKGVSESTLIDLQMEDKEDTVFVKDYQLHPVNDEVLHLDFYRVTFGEKVTTNIGLRLEGKAVGTKEGGILEVFLHDLEIELYPRYMVPSISVDISHLKIGDALHVSDLELPPESKLNIEPQTVICNVARPAIVAEPTDSEEIEETEETTETEET